MLNEMADQIHQNAIEKGWWGDAVKNSAPGRGYNLPALRESFGPGYGRPFAELMMLVVSEAAEALEDHRDGKSPEKTSWEMVAGTIYTDSIDVRLDGGERMWRPNPYAEWRRVEFPRDLVAFRAAGWKVKPVGIPSELADIIIRVLDAAAGLGVDIDEAMRIKMEYNSIRTDRRDC